VDVVVTAVSVAMPFGVYLVILVRCFHALQKTVVLGALVE